MSLQNSLKWFKKLEKEGGKRGRQSEAGERERGGQRGKEGERKREKELYSKWDKMYQ